MLWAELLWRKGNVYMNGMGHAIFARVVLMKAVSAVHLCVLQCVFSEMLVLAVLEVILWHAVPLQKHSHT